MQKVKLGQYLGMSGLQLKLSRQKEIFYLRFVFWGVGGRGGEKAESETQQKKSVIPMYSTHPTEEMALIQVPNYCNVVQSTSIGVSISSQD